MEQIVTDVQARASVEQQRRICDSIACRESAPGGGNFMDHGRASSASNIWIAPVQHQAKRVEVTRAIALRTQVQSVFQNAVPSWIVRWPVGCRERQHHDLR